jgi:tetratricopeptide (TPR) repeat protein
MSATLSFVDHLLERGRHWQRLGFLSRARSTFEHLSRLPGLSPNDFQEVHDCLADIADRQGDNAAAVRHRGVTLCLDAECGHRHGELARALLSDGRADRALEHLRLAVKFDPAAAEHHALLGQTALSRGDRDEALPALRRAAELALDDPRVLALAAHALIDAGEEDEARRRVMQARFRNHRDRRFETLWHQIQFHLTARKQADQQEPVILPMIAGPEKSRRFELDCQIFRIDQAHSEPREKKRGPTKGESKRRQRRS